MPKEPCKYCGGTGRDVIDQGTAATCPDCLGIGRAFWCRQCGEDKLSCEMEDDDYCKECAAALEEAFADADCLFDDGGDTEPEDDETEIGADDDNDATSEDA